MLGNFTRLLAHAHMQMVSIPTVSGNDFVFSGVLTWPWFPIANSLVLINILVSLLFTLTVAGRFVLV